MNDTQKFTVSSSLSSSSKPPQNTDMLRSILKGIKGVMTTRHSSNKNEINKYINSDDGSINITDPDLKNECLHCIKGKEANENLNLKNMDILFLNYYEDNLI